MPGDELRLAKGEMQEEVAEITEESLMTIANLFSVKKH